MEDRESSIPSMRLSKEMPDELPLDASWDEIYTAGTPSSNGVDYQDDELPSIKARPRRWDYLMWQVERRLSPTPTALLPPLSSTPSTIRNLTIQIEDIVDSIGDDEIGLEEVEAVLKRIQRFDPVGVAAKICATAC
nr:hypothetical protein [Klebsiella pneumoniae subsp. pneumoniae]